jgi:hypothetical protein
MKRALSTFHNPCPWGCARSSAKAPSASALEGASSTPCTRPVSSPRSRARAAWASSPSSPPAARAAWRESSGPRFRQVWKTQRCG